MAAGSRCRTTRASSPPPPLAPHSTTTPGRQTPFNYTLRTASRECSLNQRGRGPGSLSWVPVTPWRGSGLPPGGKMSSEQWCLQGETRGAGRACQERWGQEGCQPQVSPNPGGVSLRLCLCGRGWWINGASEACMPGRRGSWRGGPGSQRGHPDGRNPLWFLPFCPALVTDPPDGARSAAEESSVP